MMHHDEIPSCFIGLVLFESQFLIPGVPSSNISTVGPANLESNDDESDWFVISSPCFRVSFFRSVNYQYSIRFTQVCID